MKRTKKRNWLAVRLSYSQNSDGWSTCGSWSYAHISDPDVVYKGSGMPALIDRILSSKPAHWVMLNLDIDGRLIIGYLLHNGWTAIKSGSPEEKEFLPLISEDGRIIRIRIRCKAGLQDIQDMKRLAPVSIASLKDMVTDGVRDWRISDNVCIAARMLSQMNQDDLTRMTISGNAYNDILNMIGRHRFSQLFPKLTADENKAAAAALTGGFTWINEYYIGKHTGPGISVDANSLYPSEAMSQRLPIGKPKHFIGEPPKDNMLKIYTAVVDWDLKPDGFPVLARRWRKFEGNDGSSAIPTALTMTDVDWEIFKSNYNVIFIKYIEGWEFYSRQGVLNSYFEKWGEKKKTSQGARRLMSKFMINVIIGYFGSHTKRMSRIPVIKDDGRISYELQDPVTTRGIYAPLTAFVNAYARRTLLEALSSNKARVVYCDTDSMHLLGTDDPAGIALDDNKFGMWKVEKRFSDSVHLREKSYLWTDETTGEIQCRVSGMPENIAQIMNYDLFKTGWHNWDDETGKVIPGKERWIPVIDGERVKMVAGKYRIGG